MNARKRRIRKTIIDIAVAIIGLAALAIFLAAFQSGASVDKQSDNSTIKLDTAEQKMEAYARDAASNLAGYDDFNRAKLDTVSLFIDYNADPIAALPDMQRQWGLDELYWMSADGTVQYSGGAANPGELAAGLAGDETPLTVDTMRYYAKTRSDGGRLIGGRESGEALAALETEVSPETALSDMKVGTSGYLIAFDKATGEVVYHPDEKYMGMTAQELGLDIEALGADYDDWLDIDGTRYYCESRVVAGKYVIAALVTKAELDSSMSRTVGIPLLVFALVMSLLVVYAHMLRRDLSRHQTQDEVKYARVGKRLYFNKTVAAKVLVVALVGIIVIFGLSYYTQMLAALSRQSGVSDAKLEAVTQVLSENDETVAELTDEYSEEYTRRAQNIAYTLYAEPSFVDDDMLTQLADCARVNYIFVFDSLGRTVATNTVYKDFVLSKSPSDQSYVFWDVIKGYQEVIVQEAQPDDSSQHVLMQYVGVARLDDEGMVQIGVTPKRLAEKLDANTLEFVINNIAVENGGSLFVVDKETGVFLTYPKEKYVGRPAADYGLTQAALRDEYSGFQTIDSVTCFVTCAEYGDMFLFVSVPLSEVYSACLNTALVVTLASFLIVLVLCLLLLFSGKPGEDEDEERHVSSRLMRVTTPGGKSRITQTASSRWMGDGSLPWRDMSPEQKLLKLVGIIIALAAVVIAILLLTGSGKYDKTSILSYIVSLQWERTPNIFSLTYIAIMVVVIMAVSLIVRKLIVLFTRNFSPRSETVGRLMDSFIKYVAIIAAVFMALGYLGVDTGTLLASAGILSLVVGLGAQSLISDILAGIFIVFEGEFRVGDIVTIDTWRGTVLEIGIRTTKIEDAGQNIKIFSNSKISGVINMTKQHSVAMADVGVEYGESIERVEAILSEELPKVKDRLPAVESGPFYKGVVSLGDSSVTIRILAQCKEKDRVQLTRDLNRELKLIFDRYNINIPFPQIVVNRPTTFEKATFEESLEAKVFVKEQKELSKDIVKEEE